MDFEESGDQGAAGIFYSAGGLELRTNFCLPNLRFSRDIHMKKKIFFGLYLLIKGEKSWNHRMS